MKMNLSFALLGKLKDKRKRDEYQRRIGG
jgi:hypothetical protein